LVDLGIEFLRQRTHARAVDRANVAVVPLIRMASFVRPDIAIGSNFGSLLTAGQVFAPGAEVPLVSKKARKVSGVATVGSLGVRHEGTAVRATRGMRVFRVNHSGPQGNITSALITGAYRATRTDFGRRSSVDQGPLRAE